MENRYTMLEAAKQLGVVKMTLYHWEKAGKIPLPKRFARTNARTYTDGDIETIKRVMRIGEIVESSPAVEAVPPNVPLASSAPGPKPTRNAKKGRSRAA